MLWLTVLRLANALMLLAAPALGAPACGPLTFEGAGFTVCRVALAEDPLRLWLDDADGRRFGSFRNVDLALRRKGQALGIAMNAGMYHPDRTPVGLFIENGSQRRPVVTAAGPGNFGLLPNGVFCVRGERAAVIETRRFAEAPPACDFATQSGPMLVIDGRLHPRFLRNGTSLHVRNGVGVGGDGREVVLAISDEPVNFHHFARLFRDVLMTPNALYLDGSVSRIYAPQLGRADGGFPMGPILGTVAPAD